jgi:hypothetical protein
VRWVLGLQEKEERKHFEAVVTSVYKVPEKYIACIRYLTPGFKEL